jgi:hypothetical protein
MKPECNDYFSILRRNEKRDSRRKKSNRKARIRRRLGNKKSRRILRRNSTVFSAPSHLNLTRYGKEVAIFVQGFVRCVLRRENPATLDLRDVEMIHLEACILLYSEIERVVANAKISKPITIIDPRRRRPREVLKQIGLHTITGDSSDVVPERRDVVFWKAVRGIDQSGTKLGPIIEYVATSVNESATKRIETSGIWKGVSEAVANTIDHAYKYPRTDGFCGTGSKWTMFTQVKDGVLTVAVCDLGCGYSTSVERTITEAVRNRILGLFTSNSYSKDTQAILLAMEYGRTSTGKEERGKGSRDALRVLTEHKRGEMFVYSNCGHVKYKFNPATDAAEFKAIDLDFYVSGTIIGWVLPIERESDEYH